MEENYYKEKYIKYKTKYLELKNANSIGGIGNAGVLAASSRMQQPKMKRETKSGRINFFMILVLNKIQFTKQYDYLITVIKKSRI